ncbi:nuclear pore complex protein NUP43-like [Aristolochia californica]|uniref:nuclear pore complex protein NUP43-like n=1 Tax=Aristolochia californica TaxID=171875 RepID=UPI0035DAFBFA
MADAELSLQIHRFPLSGYVDALRFFPPLSSFHRFVVTALYDYDTHTSSLQLHSLTLSHLTEKDRPNLHLRSSFPYSSRISALSHSQSPEKPLLAASTFAGSLHFLFLDPVDVSQKSEYSIEEKSFHAGPISGIDVLRGGAKCVTVGQDGKVNLVQMGESNITYSKVGDTKGLSEFTAVRWGSEMEFATGGLGFGVQWWDQRDPRGIVLQFKRPDWFRGPKSGIVHSIDIHPSRKHTCAVGASSGTVFAWDIRQPQQPILLAGVGLDERTPSPSESEVWTVKYDTYMQLPNAGSARILPVMMSSEDGILAVLEQGVGSLELLAEACAINSFDIDPLRPSDVICSLDFETICLLTRP